MLAVWVERKKNDFERGKFLEEKLQGIRQTR